MKWAPTAVLFDFDGTLVRSMEDNFRAWLSATRAFGLEIRPEDYYELEGTQVQGVARKLFEKYGKEPPDLDEVVRRKERFYCENSRFELYPGVDEVIRGLEEQGVQTAVVTAGLWERLKATVPPSFLGRFNVWVTGDMTRQGKPAPDPYLKGMELLGHRPDECVIVENAPLGIESAKRAGVYCIAVSTTLDRSRLLGADEVVRSFRDLKEAPIFRALLEASQEIVSPMNRVLK